MADINRVTLLGRVGKDPEIKDLGSSQVANFSVATGSRWKDRDGNWQEKTQWHRVVAWRWLADRVREHLTRGCLVYVEGELETREWADRDGNKRYMTEVNAKAVHPIGAAPEAQQGGGGYGGGGGQRSGSYGQSGGYGGGQQGGGYSPPASQPRPGAPTDDDLPF